MDTQTTFPQTETDTQTIRVEVALPDAPAYEYRQMFRPKVMEFFNQTNMRSGAYLWAEQKAKEYFNVTYGIPFKAWHYRNRREPVPVN